ncbi:hypothetical protein [Bacillus sp. FJAT-22090]|uniref:hypothetical protein n=1 Tax=Bacillus sp. FJAT-22090 TaxID=1581038 RepID=UPI00119F104A|nr:hypothetical protein [Bacillus sp. FJAT-22090]
MRNAVLLPNGLVLTTDNSAGIGEKEHDVVQVDDELVAYFAARVTLMEQWAAQAIPVSIVMHNFSGNKSWVKYVTGIEKLFFELDQPCPIITGSTESNMETMQSAVAVTMIGEKKEVDVEDFTWCVYGLPSVGEEVLTKTEKIADMKRIWDALNGGLVQRVWPVGSSGIAEECKRLGIHCKLGGDWGLEKSAGPATSVLLGVANNRIDEAKLHFGAYFNRIN